MARNAEDMLVDEFVSEDSRSLLDIATGGKIKHAGVGKYAGQEGGPPALLDVAKSAYGSLKEYGARQQAELNKPLTFTGSGGEVVDTGVTQGQMLGYVSGTFGGYKNNPSQYRRVIEHIPKELRTFKGLSAAMKDPVKLVKDIYSRIAKTSEKSGRGKYEPKFIKEVLDDYQKGLGERRFYGKGAHSLKSPARSQPGGQQLKPGSKREY